MATLLKHLTPADIFAPQQGQEPSSAMKERELKLHEVRAKTERLRAERLAREAADLATKEGASRAKRRSI